MGACMDLPNLAIVTTLMKGKKIKKKELLPGISSHLGAKLRDSAARQARGRLLLLGSIVLK